MKKIVLIILYTISFQFVFGQVTNENRYNIQVRSTGYYFNRDNVNGTNHPTFLLKGQVDGNNEYDCIISWDHDEHDPYAYWNADTGSNGTSRYTNSSMYKNLVTATNRTDTDVDLTYIAYDNECSDRNTYNTSLIPCGLSPDIDGYRWCMYRYVKIDGYNYPGEWYQNWTYASDTDYGIRLERTWRYYNGESRTRPLTFGELNESDFKTHTNWNNRAASGASSSMGYLNNWTNAMHSSFDESPDVTYSFSLSVPSRVYISTNYSTTDFDTRIHLVKKISSSQWELLETNSDISGSNKKSFINVAVDAGEYFLVIEGDNGDSGKFRFYIDNTPENFDGGEISHAMPWVQNGCNITEAVSSTTDATNSFGESITYDWLIYKYITTNNGQNIDEITLHDAGSTLEPDELGAVQDSAIVRRIAKTTHIERVTDPITFISLNSGSSIDGIPADRGHNGKVEGRVVGEGTDIGIADVKIELLPHDNIHGACPEHPVTYTDNNGYFTFNRVYYGLLSESVSGQFRVVATLENHGFNKDTTIISGINLDNPNNDNLEQSPIQDTTTFFISGKIYQEDNRSESQATCGMPDVRFFVDDGTASVLKIPTSDEQGVYAVDIATIGTYDIRADLDYHDFQPADYTDIYVDNDVDNINFEDTTTHILSGSVRAGSCGFIFGSVELLIQDEAGCFIFRDTTDASGNFNMRLPARAYTINITDYQDPDLEEGYYIENIQAYFDRQTITANLNTGDYDIDLVYRQELIIEVQGIQANACGDYIFDQLGQYPVDILVREQNTDGCLLDTGSLIIIDQLSGREQATYPISQGKVEYVINPGDPNFGGDYTKLISFTGRHIDTTYLPTTEQINGIITGYKSREATFTTVSPEIPFLILRDPPGDQSYSYFQENTSSNLSLGISVLKGGSVNTWAKTRLGSSVSISAPLSPVSINAAAWGDIGGSTTVGFSNTTSVEGNLSFSHYSEYRTSATEDPSAIGQNGDIYVGAAMSMRYSKADILEYDAATCSAITSVDLVMGDGQMETEFAYSEYSIIHSLIPSLESLRDQSSTQSDIDYYQDQVDLWNQMLEWNAQLKEEATVNTSFARRSSEEILGNQSSLSWSGGGSSQTEEMTTTSSQRLSFEFNLEIDKEVSAELGYEVAGAGSRGGVNVRTRFELGVSSSVGLQQSRTTGFVLQDSDKLDRFETTVYDCPVYGTPIFKNEASITSCPYEIGSSPIDAPQLSVDEPIDLNIEPDGNAGFNFRISNLSQDEQPRSYELDIVGGTNPHGATINADLPLEFPEMPYGTTQEQFISISREDADPDIFSFEGLEFILRPLDCDANGEYASSTVKVSAYFNSTCSDVNLFEPQNGWIVNSQDNNTRTAWIKDYTTDDLDQVKLQYSPRGLNSWFNATGPLSPDDLNSNGTAGTIVNWDLNNIEDGNYDLRLKLTCNDGSIYTERVYGIIDRTAPVVHGFPMPVDDIYDPSENDVIGVNLNEEVNCDNAMVELIDLETLDTIDATITCSSVEVLINPIELLENRTPSAYRVILSDITDIYGNIADELRWVFIVGDYVYDPDCSPIEISNNNLNQDAISQSIYRSMAISSNGMVADDHTIGFKAQESITLEPGFEVENGGSLLAEIENCEND